MNREKPTLASFFFCFLRIGATSFGGNMALVSAVRHELVHRKKWIQENDLLDFTSLAAMLPGPMAVNVVAASAHKIRGSRGAALALFAVVLPSFLLLCLLSGLYFRYHSRPEVHAVFSGIMPAIAALVCVAAEQLIRQNIKGLTPALWVIPSLIIVLAVPGFWSTLPLILTAGIFGYAFLPSTKAIEKPQLAPVPSKANRTTPILLGGILGLYFLTLSNPTLLNTTLSKIVVYFSGMSLSLFGGGYVFIPTIEQIVVHQLHWLNTREFYDGIAMGQITPGPIMISAAFIGWKVLGFPGALLASISIFTPPALLMVHLIPYWEKLRTNQKLQAAFQGMRYAVIGMLLAAAWSIWKSSAGDWIAILIFVLAFALNRFYKIEPVWLICGSGLCGWLLIGI